MRFIFIILAVCELECKNDGVCVDDNVCECTDGFSGPTCEVRMCDVFVLNFSSTYIYILSSLRIGWFMS